MIVRVVSKKVEDGKLYNKKLRIVDVPDKYSFTAIQIEGQQNVYDDLREKDIETVIPKDNEEEVLILKGEFKKKTGKILSKDKKKEEVIVQVGLVDIVKLSLDDICQIYQ